MRRKQPSNVIPSRRMDRRSNYWTKEPIMVWWVCAISTTHTLFSLCEQRDTVALLEYVFTNIWVPMKLTLKLYVFLLVWDRIVQLNSSKPGPTLLNWGWVIKDACVLDLLRSGFRLLSLYSYMLTSLRKIFFLNLYAIGIKKIKSLDVWDKLVLQRLDIKQWFNPIISGDMNTLKSLF